MQPDKVRATQLLGEIAALKYQIGFIEKEANEQIERITARYGEQLKPFMDSLAEKEKEIRSLMKSRTAEIFEGADKVTLPTGILMHTKELKTTIPRDALKKIEEQGWTEAIRIAKSVDRPVVESWPEERLVVIGAKRKLVDKFGYEIK